MSTKPDSPELAMVADFIKSCAPFDLFEDAEIRKVAGCAQVVYLRRGEILKNAECNDLRIIRSGAVEINSPEGQLLDRMGEGESFSLALLVQEYAGAVVKLYEDSLFYVVPEACYKEMAASNRDFGRYYHHQLSRRLRRAARYQPEPHVMMRRLDAIMTASIVKVSPGDTIQQAACVMRDRKVSSALVLVDGELAGIITDRDLRCRVIAEGLPYSALVSDVMTVNPIAIGADATIFEAILLMVRRKIHHLPVVSVSNSKQVVGILTSSDLMLAKQDDPVYLVQHVARAESIGAMQEIVSTMPNMLVEWVRAEIKASQISQFLTAISDAVTKRLIELATEQFGSAPVPYAFLGFGSQGRGEQLLGADQDNGLLISNEMQPEHAGYFKQLAHFVSDGLAECGYTYCKGKVMATTDEWRQPLSGWKSTVDSWTRSPTPDAVMRVSIFFDIRCVYGDEDLARQLQDHMLTRASGNSIFLAALADNVLSQTPPLGIFRRFIVERNGEHKDTLDIKKRGIMPIIDMMRIHSLANKISAVNTGDRIKALVDAKVLSVGNSRNLQDAFEYIMQLRVEAQANAVLSNGAGGVSNHFNPDELPDISKRHLKDAFAVVNDAQDSIRLKYRAGLG